MVYGGAPASNANDALKFLVGDLSTSASGELLSTAECAWLIGQYGSARAAAPHAAQAIAAQFAQKVDKSVGDLRIAAQQKFEHYTTLATSLGRQTALVAVPYAGGVSVADKAAVVADSDRVKPSFTVGIHDHEGNRQDGGRYST